MAGGGEPAHVQADLGEDHLRAAGADAGDLVEPGCSAGSTVASGPVPAAGPVLPSASTPRAAGIARDQLPDAVGEPGDLGGQLSRSGPAASGLARRDGHRTCRSAPRPGRRAWPSSCRGPGRPAPRGSRSPAISASIMSRTDSVSILLATADTLISASSSSFSSRWPVPGALLDQVGPQPGVVPQLPDLRWRHERGPQHAPLGQLGQPHRIQLVFSELRR